MNILLYTPPVPKQSIHMDYLISCEPLELEYLYTVLADKHSVFFLENGKEQALYKMIASNQVSMLCISCYINHTPYILSLVERLKQKFPSLYIAVGGVYAEVVPEHFFCPFIDAVVFANQLTAISNIADLIASKGSFDLVEGAAFRPNGFQMQAVLSDTMKVPIPKRIDAFWLMFVKMTTSKAHYPSVSSTHKLLKESGFELGITEPIESLFFVPSVFMVEGILPGSVGIN